MLRAGVVPVHTHREHVGVTDLQRRGQPARVCNERKYVELSDEMHSRVQAYAEAHGLTLEQSIAKLVEVAQRRLAALARHSAKLKADSAARPLARQGQLEVRGARCNAPTPGGVEHHAQ